MSSYGAVEPGTDLSVRARELRRVRDAVLGGLRPDARPRPVVARSWSRVMAIGLAPDGVNARDPLPTEEIERRRHVSALSLVVDELRRVLTTVADASLFLMVVCDADGIILWREGAARVRAQADRLGFVEGATWTEQCVGTNAIGTALAEAAPVQLFSAEHYEQQQHPWYCTAYPLHDPRTGDLLGVVDISGPAFTLHPALGSLVESAVRLAEASLWRHHQDGLERLRREAAPLEGSGPLLVVDEHGWVAHHVGLAARDRIEVPSADRPIAVPGLGLCVPERIAHGWLIRPSTSPVSVTARLAPDGVLDVTGGERSWRTTLTRRHVQILTHLAAAGPAGADAAALSVLMHGDTDHVVTARAEVSRLRRAVGALVVTGPYRLADGVRLEVVGEGS
ncbi:transcriptional regulator [Nocardioides sp. GXZ039]|uniref:transcriptional regulator n=1 Tax=Nocardioides sp. GXZ039 TaxID=3136018 RepID=UPI0030F3EFC7